MVKYNTYIYKCYWKQMMSELFVFDNRFCHIIMCPLEAYTKNISPFIFHTNCAFPYWTIFPFVLLWRKIRIHTWFKHEIFIHESECCACERMQHLCSTFSFFFIVLNKCKIYTEGGFQISHDRDLSMTSNLFDRFDRLVFSFSFLWADASAEVALLGRSGEDL